MYTESNVCDLQDWDKLEINRIVGRLIKDGVNIRTAESCTGGGIVNTLTCVDGSSTIVDFCIVTYSPEVKQKMLNVPAKLTTDETIVSRETSESMNKGLVEFCEEQQFDKSGPFIYVSITGWIGSCPAVKGAEGDVVYFTLFNTANNKMKTFKLNVDVGNNKAEKKAVVIKRILLEVMDMVW